MSSIGSELQNSQIEASKGISKIKRAQEKGEQTQTDINLVANKVYLIGRDSSSSLIKPYYSEEEESSIEEKLHPVVYGDVLLEFMDLLYEWIKGHTHDYANKTQNSKEESFKNLKDWFDKEKGKLNSKNVFAGGDIPKKVVNSTSESAANGKLDKPTDPNTDEIDTESGLSGAINRINNLIQRADTDEIPKYKVNSSKLVDENGTHLVEFELLNPENNQIILSTSGSGQNLIQAFTEATAGLTQGILNINIPITHLPKLLPSMDSLGDDDLSVGV